MELDEVPRLDASTMIFFPSDGLIILELSFEWDICVVKHLFKSGLILLLTSDEARPIFII